MEYKNKFKLDIFSRIDFVHCGHFCGKFISVSLTLQQCRVTNLSLHHNMHQNITIYEVLVAYSSTLFICCAELCPLGVPEPNNHGFES